MVAITGDDRKSGQERKHNNHNQFTAERQPVDQHKIVQYMNRPWHANT